MSRIVIYTLRKILFWLFPGCFLMLNATSISGEEISADASWQVSSNHPGDADAINGFNQRYGMGWSPRVTRAISFDANMNYSRNETTGDIIRESLSTAGSIQVDNDLFFAEFSGLATKTDNSQSFGQLDRNWESILASNWDYPYWPSLSFSLGRNRLSDDEATHLTNSKREWYEFITEWEVETLETYYSYYTQLRDDFAEGNSYDEQRHFGRVDYRNSLFANRVDFTISGQITDSTTDFTASTSDDDILIKAGLSQGLAGIDPTPTSGRLPANPALIDGNKNSIAFTIPVNEVANLGIKTDLQQVDRLHVYTGEIESLRISATEALRWDLYSSSDGVNWQREVTNPVTVYNKEKFRYEVNGGGLQRIYLKLVATSWPTSLNIPITEIEAYRNEQDTGGDFSETQEYTRTLAELNLHYTPGTKTRVSYSLVWDDNENNTGNDRNRIFQSGSIRWEYNQYFIPTFTINNTSTTNSDIANTDQFSYAANIQSTLLPTLESNLGITRNENYTDNIRQSTNHAVHLHIIAALYPNLDSTLDINTNFNENEELGTSDEFLSLRWTLTARLHPSLLVDFVAEHGSTDVNIGDVIDPEQSGGRTTLNVNWRPSELLSILVNGSKGYGEQWSNQESFRLDTNLSLVRTSKTQVIAGYRINANEDETRHGINSNWSWTISEFFTMQTTANYSIGEQEDSWYISSRLTATF